MNNENVELLKIEATPELEYSHAAGRYGSLFLKALKVDGIFLASSCHACGTVQVPPRIICGSCWLETKKAVPVGPQGTLVSYTQVQFPFIDPFTGEAREVPYCYGMIQLDGADNSFQHFLEETEISQIHVGMRVEAVLKENRVGALSDILHFRSLGNKKPIRETATEPNVVASAKATGLNVKSFFELFNQTISTKEFAPLLDLFSEDAELTVKLLGKKHFKGRTQIEEAFKGLPRKSSMTLLEEQELENSRVVGKFELRGLPIKIRGKLTADFNSEGKITVALLST